ncbi:MAG: diguanylate cyclase, partial [Burkholderiales bacterium]|nr:diguanylate cyclase [Burkholderiales bacterium]
MRRQDNTLFWADAIAYVVNPEKPQQGTIWIFDDRTKQKQAQEEAKHLLLEQKAILDNASVGIMFSRSDLILRTNASLDTMFGYPDGCLVGQLAQIVFPDQNEYAQLVLDATRVLSSGQVFEKPECQFKRRDGSVFWGRIRSTAIDPEHKGDGTIWIIEDVTEARRDAQEMRRMLMELDAIMSNASVGIVFTKSRHITRFNQRFCEMFGYDQSHVGMAGALLYPSQEAYEKVGREAAPLLSSGKPFHSELEMLRIDGSTLWVQLIGYVLNPQDPTHGTIWIIEDRGDARRAEQSLRDALLENQAILESAVIGIAVVEKGHTKSCNRKMEEIFNYEPGGIQGVSVQAFYHDKNQWATVREEVTKDFAAGRVHSCEQLLVTKDGKPFWARLTGRPFDLTQPKGRSVWLVDDITERREAAQAVLRARDELELRVQERTAELAGANAKLQGEIVERRHIEERIHHMAYHDSLTGLPNRALLTDRLQRAMLAANRNQRSLAVMFIDLDRFKTINDTLGHLTGDRLLREVAGRLVLAVRASDTVSRLGGDEFVVLVPDLQEPQEAGLVAQKIIEMLAAPIPVEGRELHISPS